MPFARPTLTQIFGAALQDIQASGLLGSTGLLQRSVLRVLAWAVSGLSYEHFGYLDYISLQSVPWTATAENLEGWAALKKVQRKAATQSTLSASFTGTVGVTLPVGTAINAAGQSFTTLADASVQAGGTLTVSMVSGGTGSVTNLAAGSAVSLATGFAGINSAGVVASLITAGADPELDDPFRTRMLLEYAAPPTGGSQTDYVEWAEAVPGVTRAWCNALGAGAGTVVVYVMLDQAEAGFSGFPQGSDGVAAGEPRDTPASGDQLVVANALYPLQPVTALVYVIGPTPAPLNFAVTTAISPSAAVTAAIQQAVVDMLLRLGSPVGTTIYPSDWDAAIGTVPGVGQFDVTSPSSPIGFAVGQLPVLGAMTVTTGAVSVVVQPPVVKAPTVPVPVTSVSIAVALGSTTASETIATITTTGGLAQVYVAIFVGRQAVTGFHRVPLSVTSGGAGTALYAVAWPAAGAYLQVTASLVTFSPMEPSAVFAPPGGTVTPAITGLALSYPSGTNLAAPGTLPLVITAANGTAAAGAEVWWTVFQGAVRYKEFSDNSVALDANGTATIQVPYLVEGDTVQVVGSLATMTPLAVGTPIVFGGAGAVIAWAPNTVPGAIWAFDLNQIGAADATAGAITRVYNEITGAGSQYLRVSTGGGGSAAVSLDGGLGRDGGHKALTLSRNTAGSPRLAASANAAWLAAGGAGGTAGSALVNLLNVAAGANRGGATLLLTVQVDLSGGYWNGAGWVQFDPTYPAMLAAAFDDSAPGFVASAQDKTGARVATTAANLTADYHVIGCTVSGSTLTAYLDGLATGSRTLSASQGFTADDFTLGGNAIAGLTALCGAPPPRIVSMIACDQPLTPGAVNAASAMLAQTAGYSLPPFAG